MRRHVRCGDDLAVHVELVGVKPEDVEIEVTDGVLTINKVAIGGTSELPASEVES